MLVSSSSGSLLPYHVAFKQWSMELVSYFNVASRFLLIKLDCEHYKWSTSLSNGVAIILKVNATANNDKTSGKATWEHSCQKKSSELCSGGYHRL